MIETFDYAKLFASFPPRLRRFLRHELILDKVEQQVLRQTEQRQATFLRHVELAIYRNPRSPYLPLLKNAGCELGDLRVLIESQGLEGALRQLRAADVYVTFEEFKGRTLICRNGVTVEATPSDFDNPVARRDFQLSTGGSTGLANAVYQDLEHIRELAFSKMIVLNVHNTLDAPLVHWSDILPGAGIRLILQHALISKHTQRWYSVIGWRDSKYWLKYGAATMYMVAWMKALGARIEGPHVVKPDQATIIVHVLRDTLKAYGRVLFCAGVSQAVRVSVSAQEQGLDLTGTTVRVGSEPLTPAKESQIVGAGMRIITGYGSTETGRIGYGCSNRTSVDDVHVMKNAFALITHPHNLPHLDLSVPAFNLTSLRQNAPKVMLNYQIDDYGVVETRRCGCALDLFDCTTHAHTIRSYSKLVGEGVTLIGNDIVRILEEVLPARFGGTPLDYQMMEEEDAGGLTRLALIISPRVDIRDEQEVVNVLLAAMQESSPMTDAARTVWQNAQTIHVRRCKPILTARGKLLPLHLKRH